MRQIKRLAAVLICATLALPVATSLQVKAAGNPVLEFKAEETTENAKKKEALSLRLKGENTPSFKYGETKNLELTLKNKSENEIQDITVVPKVTTGIKNWPFEIEKVSYEQKVQSIKAEGAVDIVFSVKARQNVESKYYKVMFEVKYGEETLEQSVFVKMEGKPEEPKEPSKEPSKDPSDGQGDVGGGSVNNFPGEETLEQSVFVKMEGKPEEPKEPSKEPSKDPSDGQGDVGGGSVNNFPPSDGGVDIPLTDGGSGGGGSETSNTLTPRVIVTGFSTDPAEVKAGTNFKLIVHLKNTSKKTAVKNMLFDFNAPAEGTDESTTSPAFLPSSGSSVVYLESIKANGAKDISIDLNAKADLLQKPYSIDLSMKYEDGNGGQYESAASISLPIKQDARFEFSEFEMSSDTVEVGSEVNIMCNLYNLGRVKLYNVKARFEGEGLKSKELFVGNVESGATAVIDGMVTGEQVTTGDGKAKLLITYEDEAGTVSTAEKELTLYVTEPVPQDAIMDDPSMMEPEEEKGFPVIPVVAAVIVVAAVVAVILVKKHKKKKAKEEEEEFLEDELDRLTEDE